MTSPRDYYAVMGIEKGASEKEIKTAYRRLARKYHPDISKEPNAEEKFKELGQAYDVLKDPEKRALYDKYGHEGPAYSKQQQQNSHHYSQQASAGAGFNFDEDFLQSIFGHQRRQRSVKGEDFHANLTLSLEDAYRGTTRQIEIPIQQITPDGQITTTSQVLNVNIPKGVTQGQKLRLAGQGAPGFNNGPKGDLFLSIHFHKHPLYELRGHDLYLTLPIAPWEAALGANVKVPTLGGQVDLKIPANSQSGQKLRLKGRGLPSKTPGDQYILLKIVIPPADNDIAKKLYEEMKQIMPFNPRAQLGV